MKKILSTIALMIAAVSMSFAQTPVLPKIEINTNGTKISSNYVKGTITITDTDGSLTSLNAKFKTRGATAADYSSKPSLNMKLRDADDNSLDSCLLGLRSCSKWILDAMAIDRICMRNRVAMDIWNAYASLPYETSFPLTNDQGETIYRSGTIAKYAEVTINGTYKGLYMLSDHINRKLLDLKKVAKKETTDNDTVRGVLYKSGTTDISDQSTPAFSDDYKTCVVEWHNAWELKEPEDYECKEAWNPLLDAFGSSLASGTGVKISNYNLVKKYFYIDNLIDYQLHIMALGIQDNWGNKNHYFSIRNIQKNIDDIDATEANKRKFFVSPWDLDTSLGGHYKGNYYGGNYGTDWTPQDVVKNGGFFPFSICQGNAEYTKLLQARWKEVRKTAFYPSNVNKRLETYCDLLVSSGAWERNGKVQPRYVSDLAKEIDYIETWYANRFQMIDAYFGITDGIEEIADNNSTDNTETIFSLDGRKLQKLAKGINIVKMSDGKYRKVLKLQK